MGDAGASDDASQAAAVCRAGREGAVVEDRRGLTVLIRNALFHRVQLMDLDKPEALALSTRSGATACMSGRTRSTTSTTNTST